MSFQINLNQLQAFNAVIRTKTLKEAGDLLSISPPAVSIQIKNLEQAIGFKLFNRKANGLELNAEGNALVGYTKKIFDQLELLNNKIENFKSDNNSSIRIGINATPAEVIAPLLFNYTKLHLPEVELSFLHGSHTELVEMLRTNKVDFLIKGDIFLEEDFLQQKFINFRIPFIVSANNPLAKEKYISLEKLATLPLFIAPLNSSLSRHIYSFFEQNNIPLPSSDQTIPPNLILKFVEKTNHGAFFNSLVCEDLIDDGRLVELNVEKNPESLHFYIAYTEEALQENKIVDFLEILKDYQQVEAFRIAQK